MEVSLRLDVAGTLHSAPFNTLVLISIVMLSALGSVYAQRPGYTTNDLYQYNYTTISPAFAGIEGQKMSFVGSVWVPNNRPYYGFGFMSIEAPISKINSGVGFSASIDSYENASFSNLNFLYNYQWNIDEFSKFIIGAKLTSTQMAFDFSLVSPIDPNDPIRYTGVSTANTMLGGAAVLYKHKKMFAGFSVDNLIRTKYRLHNLFNITGFHDRQYNFILGSGFMIGERSSTTHSIYVINKNDFWRFDINNSILLNNWLIGGLSLELNNSDHDNEILPKVNAGVKIKDKAQVMFSVYSEAYNMGSKKFSGQMMLLFNL
jgi:type IX secretion system PorP/SprF family membrane protein